MVKRLLNPLREFLENQRSQGLVLIGCTIASLLLANSNVGPAIQDFWHHEFILNFGRFPIELSTKHWVDDGLMTVFFLLVGLEMKRELLQGELSTFRKAALPAAAALGGMVVPALIYYTLNNGLPTSGGWGIPMATDIAFALGILSIAGSRVPASLKVFLTALAVIDDLGAVLVIAVFYTASLHGAMLAGAGICLAVLIAFNLLGVRFGLPYILVGLVLWYFVLHSGIHATIAGVLLAAAIPLRSANPERSLLLRWEHHLHLPVNFIVMPLFAIANTAIAINPDLVAELASPLGIGIAAGLLAGKPIGILLFSIIPARLGWFHLPHGARPLALSGVAILGGIGFTMSIFIANLAIPEPGLLATAKLAILATSTTAGIMGLLFLLPAQRQRQHAPIPHRGQPHP